MLFVLIFPALILVVCVIISFRTRCFRRPVMQSMGCGSAPKTDPNKAIAAAEDTEKPSRRQKDFVMKPIANKDVSQLDSVEDEYE